MRRLPSLLAIALSAAACTTTPTPEDAAMDVRGIDHVYVETTDFERTRAFWEELGFTVAETWGADGHRAGRLVSGDAVVVLATAHGDAGPARPTVHLRVPDTASAQRSLDTADGVAVTRREEPTHWGTRWIRVRDPDGNDWVLEQVEGR